VNITLQGRAGQCTPGSTIRFANTESASKGAKQTERVRFRTIARYNPRRTRALQVCSKEN
jgi:hypothetical protein